MKKLMTLSGWLVMAAAITLATTACSSDDNIVEEPMNPTTAKTYHMSLTASKGDGATTRALSLNGKTLNATWATGDKVYVFNYGLYVDDNYNKKYVLGGYLEAKSDGTTVTLEGDLTGIVEENDVLFLAYPQINLDYTGQDGTLTKIASTYDYTTVMAKVTNVSGGKITVVNYDPEVPVLQFGNGQAIVKFTLQDQGGNAINATNLTISAIDGSSEALVLTCNFSTGHETYGPITITPVSPTNVIYAALEPNIDTHYLDCTLTATDGTNTYTYTKSHVQFLYGKYYEITVKMKKLIDLSNLTGNYEAQNGDVLTGTLDGSTQPYKISIADGATVTLDGVTINGVNNNSYTWAGINCEGDATIILADGSTNTVNGFYQDYPGIFIAEGKTLTIQGSGSLTASGGGANSSYGAGIGGAQNIACGNIVIEGGTVTATSGSNTGRAAGIGGGANASCGDISISGTANVTATGAGGAGIGGGYGTSDKPSTCGDISISGTAHVTATSTGGGAGIGGGNRGTVGAISISGTANVIATGGMNGAGIGSGYYGTVSGTISIEGGTVTATGGGNGGGQGAGIGSGHYGKCNAISISSGITQVVATMKGNSAHIGAGCSGSSGKVTIDDVDDATTSSTFLKLNSAVSGNTWTLTHK